MGIGVVQTNYGALKGVHKQTYTVFRGVPYARPPVGDLRWRAPQPPVAWNGVREAKVFGPCSMQSMQPPGSFYHKEFFNDEDFIPPMSEDSLYLNIWTPAESGGEALPVAFWIHGGAFVGGYGTEPEFDGKAYCDAGVILVTINYRLGAFGFLAHPWLSEESELGISGNYGILDQIAALTWVRENIAAFGGDPNRITIFGQSAGSIGVQTLVSSPLTQGMIAGAILQSAGGYNAGVSRDVTMTDAETSGQAFLSLCRTQQVISSLSDWRAMPEQMLVAMSGAYFIQSFQSGNPGLAFAPCIDGHVLPMGYSETIEKGMHHDIPYMLGSTKNDIGVTPEMVAADEKSALYKGCIAWSLLGQKLGRSPAYVYYFTRQLLGDNAGAFHSSELWYQFDTLHRSWRPKDDADWDLARRMSGYFANFVKTGDPNGEGLPPWSPCTEETQHVQELR